MKTKSAIAILIISFFLFACAQATPVSITETAPVTITATSTLTPTISLTFTPLPTATISTPTATPTLVPTYTPATPSKSYKLKTWSADEADSLVAQINSNLSAIENEPLYQSVYGFESYMEQYKYLAIAEKEALLRFPIATQAERWRWDLCNNLALSYPYAESTDAPELQCYAKLIEDGLNSRATTLDNLPNWFANHEGRFPFAIKSHPAPNGVTSAHVITLQDNAILWLLEKSGEFQTVGLMSSMFFFRETGVHFEQLDLTGDGYPELILTFGRSYCCGAFTQQFVYDVSQGKPRQLLFKNLDGTTNHIGSEYDSYITALESKSEPPGLLFKGLYGDPLTQPCHLREYDKYYWDGYQFEWSTGWLGVDEPGEYDDKEFCRFVIDAAKEQGEVDVEVRTIGDARISDPDVTRDQILYRLGEYHARLKNVEKAEEFFKAAIALQPTDKPASQWGKASKIFLDGIQKDSYYGLCAQITQCDMHEALIQLLDSIRPDSFLSATELLKKLSVSILSNGYTDFYTGYDIEQWLVVQHPHRPQREFWILVKGNEKIYGIFVDTIPNNKPRLKDVFRDKKYLLATTDGESLVSPDNLSLSNQPFVLVQSFTDTKDPIYKDNYLKHELLEEALDNAVDQLLNGTDPRVVKERLVQLNQSKNFNCEISKLCDKYDYLLGMITEITGDSKTAVDIYIQLWKKYPDSFYAIMARAKLINTQTP